jgi:hypothetical protein
VRELAVDALARVAEVRELAVDALARVAEVRELALIIRRRGEGACG